MSRTIIGLCGYKGCGKTTAAKELMRLGYSRIRFAQGLKAMLHCLGLTEEHTDGKLKEVPCDLLDGRTPRHAMQTLGAEWGRDLISPTLWVNDWVRRVKATSDYIPIVVDDLRYPNEVALIRSFGGSIKLIKRTNVEQSSFHSSEDLTHINADQIILNHRSLREFQILINYLGRTWK